MKIEAKYKPCSCGAMAIIEEKIIDGITKKVWHCPECYDWGDSQ